MRRVVIGLLAVVLLTGSGCGEPPPEVVEIAVTGGDFEWHCRYAGPDGTLGTADDVPARNILHVPAHTRVVIHLTSRDYLYTFKLPQLKAKEIAVPQIVFKVEFRTEAAGTFELRGDQLCGFTHESLDGQLIVDSLIDFRRWLGTRAAKGQSP